MRLIFRLTIIYTFQHRFKDAEITEIIFKKYFAHSKMRRYYDDKFFDSINKVFVCLVTSAMRHCLKALVTGQWVEPMKSYEFKYESGICKFKGYARRICPENSLIRTPIADFLQPGMPIYQTFVTF